MADKKSQQREQNEETAKSIRDAVKDVRGGMTQANTNSFLERLEGIVKGIESQGKTQDELAEEAAERGEPDPNKTAAELIVETQEKDKESEAQKKKGEDSASSPSASQAPKASETARRPLGEPVLKAQNSTMDRDRQESTVKTALDSVKRDSSTKK